MDYDLELRNQGITAKCILHKKEMKCVDIVLNTAYFLCTECNIKIWIAIPGFRWIR